MLSDYIGRMQTMPVSHLKMLGLLYLLTSSLGPMAFAETLSFTNFTEGEPQPVLKGSPGAWDETLREKIQVIKDGSVYKMWYVGYRGSASNEANIGYATSLDGKQWTKYSGNPIIDRATQDHDMAVLKVGSSLYYMYIETNDSYLDLMTSTDGIRWTLHPASPVKRDAASPVVWREGSSWFLLYEHMVLSPRYNIHLATSTDGIHWTDSASNPVLSEAFDTVPDSIVKDGNTYHLYYHVSAGSGVWPAWHATSTHLTQWTNRRELRRNDSSQLVLKNSNGEIWSYIWQLMGDGHYYLKYGLEPDDGANSFYHWKLDETSGEVAFDSSGNFRDGRRMNGPVWTQGRVDGALSFDGIDDSVDTGFTGYLAKWSISCWVRSPQAPQALPASGPINMDRNFQINWNHPNSTYRGTAVVRVNGAWHAASFGPLPTNTWIHLAATYDGETLRSYKNGVLVGTNSVPSGFPEPEANSLKLGRHAAAAQYFQGAVDDVRVYGRVLAADEMGALAGLPAPSYVASAGFSSTQGRNQWRYQYSPIGTLNYYDMPHYISGFNGWSKEAVISPEYTVLWATGGHPGTSNDTVRTWTAPSNGVAVITNHGGNVRLQSAASDGVTLSVLKSNVRSPIWSATVSTTTGVAVPSRTVTVAAGDRLHFRINKYGSYTSDSVVWNPSIRFYPAP